MSKRKSKPTSKKRSATQRIKDRYAHAREDAQLAGLIPTTPEESLGSEVAPPGDDPPQIGLVAAALRQGWAVPDEVKPALVDELLKIVTAITDEQGEGGVSPKTKVAAFNALRMADQQQYERDYPERAAKAKGGGNTTNVVGTVVQSNLAARDLIRQMVLDGELGCVDSVQAPAQPSPLSNGRLEREVEAIPPPGSDQQPTG